MSDSMPSSTGRRLDSPTVMLRVALHRIMRWFVPRVKIEVRPGAVYRTWWKRVDMKSSITARSPLTGEVVVIPEGSWGWTAFPEPGPQSAGPCRICKTETTLAALRLCPSCFVQLSNWMRGLGILINPADDMIRRAGRWIRLASRYNLARIWVYASVQYCIVPGKDIEFCNTVNGFLQLQGSERVTTDALSRGHSGSN